MGTALRLADVAADRRERMSNAWDADLFDQVLEYAYVGQHGAPDGPGAVDELLMRWGTRIWEPGLPLSLTNGGTGSGHRIASARSLGSGRRRRRR